jgi:CubicO group peptidase (beta-lactamase class C family)
MLKIKYFIFLLLIFITPKIFAKYQYHYQDIVDLEQIFNSAIADRSFPGGCIIAGTVKQAFVNQCFGYYTFDQHIPDQIDSIFDLASLTKVIATTPAIMKLVENKKIKLSDKVVRYLPEFKGPNEFQTKLKAQITIEDLLTHSSGLPADNQVNEDPNPEERWQKTLETPVIYYKNEYEIYSDVGFEILGKIVEKVSGMSLDKYTQKYIFKPLKMQHTFFNPPSVYYDQIVPTSTLLIGQVQDEIAYSLGGVSGHAGLFSTTQDLSIFAKMLLNNGKINGVRIFQAKTIKLFTKRARILPHSSRALGWDTVYDPKIVLPNSYRAEFYHDQEVKYRQPQQFSAGIYIDPDAFGHTGFTGTSIWISKKYGIYVILLTNKEMFSEIMGVNNHKYYRQKINSAIWENLGFEEKNLLLEEKLSTIS